MTRRSLRIWIAIGAGALVLVTVVRLGGPGTVEHSFRPHPDAGLAPPERALDQVRTGAASMQTRNGDRTHGTVPTPDPGSTGSSVRNSAEARVHTSSRFPPDPSPEALPGRTRSAWPNVRVDQAVRLPEETAIAIDPTDANRIVAVAQGVGCYYFRSSDGGATWAEGSITDPYDLGDPTLAMDANGVAYCGYIGTFQHSGIYITRSTDGGITWQPGVPVIEHDAGAPFEDKEYPACDRTNGSFAGSLYVGWTQFDRYPSTAPTDSTRILLSYSRDQGITFAPPVKVSDRGGDCVDGGNTVEGAVPAVGPDGTVYLAWAGPRGIEFDRSTDGGCTWGVDRVISDMPGGWDFAVPGIYRANGLPITKTDLSIGPFSGRVYVAWSDQRNGDTDVFLVFSDDRGAHWSPRVRVNGDPVGNGRDQFFPWIDVDPMTGHVYIVYYDRRATTGVDTEVWLATSTDGGATFTEEVISQSPFTPDPAVFFGDYIGLAAHNGRVRPFWMRLDGQQLSVWTALIEHNPADTVLIGDRMGFVVVPNPARTVAHVYAGGTRLTTGGVVQVFGADGRVVRSLPTAPMPEGGPFANWDLQDESGRRVPAGVYLIRSPAGAAARLVVTR